MTDPTGNSPTSRPEPPESGDASVAPVQPEDFAPRRRSLYAVPLWTRSAPEADAPERALPIRRRILVFVGAAALAGWILLALATPRERPGPPPAPPIERRPIPSWTATPFEGRPVAGEAEARPVYRRLTDRELLSQFPPGTVIVE